MPELVRSCSLYAHAPPAACRTVPCRIEPWHKPTYSTPKSTSSTGAASQSTAPKMASTSLTPDMSESAIPASEPDADSVLDPGSPSTVSTRSMEADAVFDDDTDSNYAEDWASDITSLKSDVWRHVYENGRRYHSYREGKYHFPNDEKESNRIEIEHHNQGLQLGGRLHLAPLDHPQEIIDLGTGTGIWCIDVGEMYPSARVVGVDLSPIQPEWVPPNVSFEIDDFEADWWGCCIRFLHPFPSRTHLPHPTLASSRHFCTQSI